MAQQAVAQTTAGDTAAADGGRVPGSLRAWVCTAAPRGERSSGESSASEPEWLRDAQDRLTDTDSCASCSRRDSPPPELLTRVAMLEAALAAATEEAGLAEAKAARALEAEAGAQAAAQLARAEAVEVQASAKLEVAASEARAAAASATAAAASATAAAAAAAGVAEARRRAAKEAYDAAVADQMAAEERAATATAHPRGQADAPPPAASLTAPPAAPLPSVASPPSLLKPGQLTPGHAGRSTGPADGGRTGAFDPRELYEPLGLIGRGSYGSVFRARDRRSGELVAIKVAPRA